MVLRMTKCNWMIWLISPVLAGCAVSPTSAPPAGTQFDGSYATQDSLLNGVAFQCGAANLTERLEVRGGQFDYPFQVAPPRTAPLPVQLFADGTVYGQMQYGTQDDVPERSRLLLDWVTLQGRISGTTLDATISNLHCARHLVAQRSEGPNALGR